MVYIIYIKYLIRYNEGEVRFYQDLKEIGK